MKLLFTTILWLLHMALILVWPLLLVGVIRRTKAVVTCRRGPPLLQAFFDLAKLGQKGEVLASTTTWVFRSAPWVTFFVVVVVGMLVPTFSTWAPLEKQADLILLVYLLGLERFYRTIAALDTGTSFAGLGASRESFISSLAEPALVLSLWCTGLLTGTLYIPEMVSQFSRRALLELSPAYLLVLLPLVLVTLAENARIPVDDPTTHLELTMVHEAMGLEYSGRGLALIEWGSMIRLGLYFSLVANLFFPVSLADPAGLSGLFAGIVSFLGRTAALAVGVGLVEATLARLAFFRIADMLGLAAALAFLALIRVVTVGR